MPATRAARVPLDERAASRSSSGCCSGSASTARRRRRCRADLDAWLAGRQMSPEDAIRVEGQREAADQVSMANAITSLRFCATHDWSRFVESVSQVETILHHDPVGVYGRMDFASRDRYRQSLEALADGTGEGQVHVARQSVERRAVRRAPAQRARRACRLLPDRPGPWLSRGAAVAEAASDSPAEALPLPASDAAVPAAHRGRDRLARADCGLVRARAGGSRPRSLPPHCSPCCLPPISRLPPCSGWSRN